MIFDYYVDDEKRIEPSIHDAYKTIQAMNGYPGIVAIEKMEYADMPTKWYIQIFFSFTPLLYKQ